MNKPNKSKHVDIENKVLIMKKGKNSGEGEVGKGIRYLIVGT